MQVKSRPCDVRFDDDLQQIEGFLRGTNPEWCIGKQGLSTASQVKGGLISEGIFTLIPSNQYISSISQTKPKPT